MLNTSARLLRPAQFAFAALLAFAVLLPATVPLPARATVPGVGAGDLIKLKDDHNPLTISDKVVYYLDADWKRHPFPNQRVFNSWYHDFLQLKEITPEEMAEFRMGAPIRYRAGTRLVKIASVNMVYAVEPGGMLRAIESEQIARDLFGADWNKRIDDVDESFFASYIMGAPLSVPVWPTGTLVKRSSDGKVFMINGLMKHPVDADVMYRLRLWEKNAIVTDSDLNDYGDLGPLTEGDLKIIDTSELARIETEPLPAVDFPYKSQGIKPTANSILASFRATAGAPVSLKGVTIAINGLPKEGGSPLTNLHFTDVNGNDLFGIQQLEIDGTGAAAMTFSGSTNLSRNSVNAIQFRADVSGTYENGTKLSFGFPRSGLKFTEDNGNAIQFWYPTQQYSKAK